MATLKLYSVQEGKVVDWDAAVDNDGEIIVTHKDESLKFPAGLTKESLLKLVDKHNKANEGTVALSEEEIDASVKLRTNSEKLLESL